MADRRMFAKSIVLSDAFLDMPATARCLYFTLGMFADDDGFVNSPKSIMRQCGASMDDMNVLLAKKFVYSFDGGVVVLKHWRINNLLRADRHRETTYTEELKLLEIDENGAYKLVCQPTVNQLSTNCQPSDNQVTTIGIPSIGKVRIGKDSIGKVRVGDTPTITMIDTYIQSKGYKIDPHRFFEYYTTDGRTFPKDWKSVVDKWQETEYTKKPKSKKPKYMERDTSCVEGFGTEYLQKAK
jgi:hypothetical protein